MSKKKLTLTFLSASVVWLVIGGIVYILSEPSDSEFREETEYISYEDRVGKFVTIKGERLMIINHNFWSSTYTLSNNVQVDDDFINKQLPPVRKKVYLKDLKCKGRYPLIAAFVIFWVFFIFGTYILLLDE